jgi:hypothetical protein
MVAALNVARSHQGAHCMVVGRTGLVGTLLSGLAAVIAAIALGAVVAPAADAASYDVWTCRGPAGEALPTAGWSFSSRDAGSPDDVGLTDTCADGGRLQLAMPDRPVTGSPKGYLTFTAPAGTTIAGYSLWRYLYSPASGPGFNYYFTASIRERTALADSEEGCASVLSPPNWNCSQEGSATAPLAASNLYERTGVALDALQLSVACSVNGCDAPFGGRVAMARIYSARIALEDSVAPETPQLSGSLAEAEPVDRRGTLVVESADEGGGIAAMTMALDGGAPQTIAPAGPRGTCSEPYTIAQPCPSAAARLFTLDTSALAEGSHELSGTVVDAAGNATPYGPLGFTVAHAPEPGDGGGDPDDGGGTPAPPPVVIPPPPIAPPIAPPSTPAPPAGNGSPAVRAPKLTLDRSELVRRQRRAERLTGTLRTAAGQPITGARLTVSARELGTVSDRARALPDVTTGGDGRFAVTVGGSGARRIEVSFAPTADAADTARATAVVLASARLTASRSRARLSRGQAVVIAGRLDGAGTAARGAVVEVQAIVRGEWRTVGTVHAGAGGRYRWRYRFVNLTRDTIFSFRALVRASPGWPWPELTTERVQVRVDAD